MISWCSVVKLTPRHSFRELHIKAQPTVSLYHIATRGKVFRFNPSRPSNAYMRRWIGSSFGQIMACVLFGAKPLSQPMLDYCWLELSEQIAVKFELKLLSFHSKWCTWKCRLQSGAHFVTASMCSSGAKNSVSSNNYSTYMTAADALVSWRQQQWQFNEQFIEFKTIITTAKTGS